MGRNVEHGTEDDRMWIIGTTGAAASGHRERTGGRRRLFMALGAAAAGYYLYKQRASKSAGSGAIFVSKAVTIDKPVGEVYGFWRNFENLPRVMGHLESVTKLSGDRSRWTAKGPAGTEITWEAETLVDRENELISWRSIEGATVPNEGTVRFRSIDGGQRTEVKVSLTYHPPGGKLGAAVAKLFGEEPAQQIREDLRRFKRDMESGTIITGAYARPSGRQATV